MELKLFILSLGCLSCLVPPALSTFLGTELAAAGAAKDAALVGAGVLAKGAVLKGAALLAALAAKGALLGGAALLGAKALKAAVAIKAAALAHSKPVLLPTSEVVPNPVYVDKSVFVEKPFYVQKTLPVPTFVEKPHLVHKTVPFQPFVYQVQKPSVVVSPPSPSKIVDRLQNLLSVGTDAVINKTAAIGQLVASLLPSETVVNPPHPLVYQIISAPKFYPVPIFEKTIKKK